MTPIEKLIKRIDEVRAGHHGGEVPISFLMDAVSDLATRLKILEQDAAERNAGSSKD